MDKWVFNQACMAIDLIKGLKQKSIYLSSRSERNNLSDIYRKVGNLGSTFPNNTGYSNSTAMAIRKRVNDHCPSCISKKAMQKHIDSVFMFLVAYKKQLEDFIKEFDSFDFDASYSVHDLKRDDEQK